MSMLFVILQDMYMPCCALVARLAFHTRLASGRPKGRRLYWFVMVVVVGLGEGTWAGT